jgi:signal transduction histidine kinase
MSLSTAFARQPRAWIFAEMMVSMLVIGVLDFISSYQFRLLPLYVGPIFVVAWFFGKNSGIVTALFSSVIWWGANWFNGDPDLHNWVQAWEISRHVGFFLVVALIGSALRGKSDIAATRIALLEHSQQLEREIVNISEAEQRRIGQDLHDGLCQYLAALGCSAISLRDDLQKLGLPAEADAAGELATLLQNAVVQTRDLARGLVPAHVGQVGIIVALESLAESVSRLQGITCTFRFHGPVANCDDQTAMHLYRIAQEAINNSMKHGKASKIAISLDAAGDLMTLRILDDGVGIPGFISTGTGVGIMRNRARLSGGEFRIEQPKGGGTMITCTIRKRNPQESEIAAA